MVLVRYTSLIMIAGLKYSALVGIVALGGIIIALQFFSPIAFNQVEYETAKKNNLPQTETSLTIDKAVTSPPTLEISEEESGPEKIASELEEEKGEPLLPVATPSVAPAVATALLALSEPRFPTEGIFAEINERTRNSLVNIFCTRKSGRVTRTISGSGTIIDSRGVVLTNAHVAELFLLEGRTSAGYTNCELRKGNPAQSAYDAKLLYMPEKWIRDFAPKLSAKEARGTGESDFALLLITSIADQSDASPRTFPYVPVNINRQAALKDDRGLIASYPAHIETVRGITKNLYLVSTLATIEELFTFDGDNLDLIALGGTIASEEGSSGGAVVNSTGSLVGIIVTSTLATTTLDRKLRALSLEHIDRKMIAGTGFSLVSYLSVNLKQLAKTFEEKQRPGLAAVVLQQFNK